VLDEEADLRQDVQADTDTPFIKQNFFKEIFEKKMMGLHGAELSTDDNKTEKTSDSDEEAFMHNQRKQVHNNIPIIRHKAIKPQKEEDLRCRQYFNLKKADPAVSDSCVEDVSNSSYFENPESPRNTYDQSQYSEFSRMLQTTNSDRKTCPNTLADLSETQESENQTTCSEFSSILTPQTETIRDDQSELDEQAALKKQRQNQKKKQRKKNKKKVPETSKAFEEPEFSQFDIRLS
jgi:hypothetical protein